MKRLALAFVILLAGCQRAPQVDPPVPPAVVPAPAPVPVPAAPAVDPVVDFKANLTAYLAAARAAAELLTETPALAQVMEQSDKLTALQKKLRNVPKEIDDTGELERQIEVLRLNVQLGELGVKQRIDAEEKKTPEAAAKAEALCKNVAGVIQRLVKEVETGFELE